MNGENSTNAFAEVSSAALARGCADLGVVCPLGSHLSGVEVSTNVVEVGPTSASYCQSLITHHLANFLIWLLDIDERLPLKRR